MPFDAKHAAGWFVFRCGVPHPWHGMVVPPLTALNPTASQLDCQSFLFLLGLAGF